ncbi:metalloendopeptidase, partial [Coemansia sp. BCRC 34301]
MSASSVSKGTVLNFNLSPADIEHLTETLIAQNKKVQDEVAAQTNPTFANVIVPLATLQNEQSADISVVSFLQNVSTDKDIRDASMTAEKKLDAFEIESNMREDVYKAVRAVFDNESEMASLGSEDRRLVEKMERVFRRHGLALDKDQRERLGKIKVRLSELATSYSHNINEGDGKAVFTRDELEGLSSDFFEGRATETIDGQEGFVVTTKYPDVRPVLRLAKREETREHMIAVRGQRCPDNIPILQEAVGLRLEAAQLLGYKTHAEFALEEKMAKAPEPVLEFENDLRSRLNILADKEIEEIAALKKADMEAAGKPHTGLYDWDYSYYTNLLKERKHDIDNEEVKQYFPIKEVTRGILDIYQDMLSLKFVKVDNPPVWHEDVELYEVWEAASDDTFVGHFYLDLFPREGKYNHAAVSSIRPGYDRPDGSREYPVAAMMANFPKPTLSAPALLTHSDVTTFLHELGHAFHGMCAFTKWSAFHGTKTERDFVEAPSQMLENWSWEPSVLQKFAVHHQTGEPIPEALVKRLVAAKNEGAGLTNLRQVFYGLYDMGIHSITDGEIDVKELYNELFEDITRFNMGDHDTWSAATFGHLMGGYDAGYYGYMWSQVFSADMYASRFAKEG